MCDEIPTAEVATNDFSPPDFHPSRLFWRDSRSSWAMAVSPEEALLTNLELSCSCHHCSECTSLVDAVMAPLQKLSRREASNGYGVIQTNSASQPPGTGTTVVIVSSRTESFFNSLSSAFFFWIVQYVMLQLLAEAFRVVEPPCGLPPLRHGRMDGQRYDSGP